MDVFFIVLGILFVSFACIFYFTKSFFEQIYNSENHTEYDINTIKSHASITNVKSKPVGVKINSTFRVTVYFSDGFKYIAHDSVVIDYNSANFTMALTSTAKKQILFNAIEAHTNIAENKNTNTLDSIPAEKFEKIKEKLTDCEDNTEKTILIYKTFVDYNLTKKSVSSLLDSADLTRVSYNRWVSEKFYFDKPMDKE